MKPRPARAALVALVLGLSLAAARERPARAAPGIERFAVIIGNDLGAAGEAALHYAEADAARMAEVLEDVGGFAPENVIVLRGRDAGSALRAIITVNERIRTRAGALGDDTVLLVYYSGHGDRRALHLGGSRFDLTSLEKLVRGSSATVRLLVVDSCNSGALTRVKGGRSAPRMTVELGDRLSGEGIVFLTSSAASEEAQESDELKGSFFTHYLASGLLGAADANQDGVVVLKEAYRHAYENTIRATSSTAAGVQHPMFRYELGGQGDIVLSRLRSGGRRARVRLPSGASFLLFHGDGDGSVVAEVGAHDAAREVSLKPGRYFVRARGAAHLLEGMIDLPPGAVVAVDPGALTRVDYARLVRKGSTILTRVHGPTVGYQVRTALVEGESVCHGPAAAYVRELPDVRLSVRAGFCRAHYANQALSATNDELHVSARAARAWDTPAVSFDAGAALGASLLRQTFDTRGTAPARHTAAAHVEIGASAIRYLPSRFYLALEIAGLAYALQTASDSSDRPLVVRLAARTSLELGMQF
ncbi:MAG TPA: caspase family protein [Kofleriaceae bacterium]|nr:caspase family protein [Kofleriaceae bacterium]